MKQGLNERYRIMVKFLEGKKTYILAAILVLVIVAFLAGLLTLRGSVVAFGLVIAAAIWTLRAAIAKVITRVPKGCRKG